MVRKTRTQIQPVFLMLFFSLALFPAAACSADKLSNQSQSIGFRALEIYKLADRSTNMLAGDLNSDGLVDLAIADNSHSRIDLLLQKKQNEKTSKQKPIQVEANLIENDLRFEHRKIPVDKQITSMILGDFNNDQRIDIAYLGTVDRLIIRYQPQQGKTEWNNKLSLRLPELATSQWSLATGDINQDGKSDIVALGKKVIYLLHQQVNGKMSSPKEVLNTSSKLSLLQVKDLNGDQLDDIGYIVSENSLQYVCVRLQSEQHLLGPELRFKIGAPRGVTFTDIDGRPGAEILLVDARTNRVKVMALKEPDKSVGDTTTVDSSRLTQYGFGESESRQLNDLATGDLDGDGLQDVIVTDPANARIILFRQHPKAGLDLGTPFPGLVGVNSVRISDFDGDKKAEVILLSSKEKVIGISRLNNNRITFPQTVSIEFDPLTMDLADLNKDNQQEIVYISRKQTGRTSEYYLAAKEWKPNGSWSPYTLAGEKNVKLKLTAQPDRIRCIDANQDGRTDFLVFLNLGRGIQLFLTDQQGKIQEVTSRGGIRIGNVPYGAFSMGQLDRPAILVAQQNFARNIVLNKQHQWQVLDQYNVVESKSKIVGTATLNLDDKTGNEIVLVDAGLKKLRILKKQGAQYLPWREVDFGQLQYLFNRVVDLDGDQRDDLLLFGKSTFAVLYAGSRYPQLKQLAAFETDLKKTFFTDVIAGDLSSDGQKEIAVIDTQSHYLELIKYHQPAALKHALHFKIFEEKGFRAATSGGTEPREALIQDVTGDGLADLVLLVHDRVLVYPQDDGK